MSRAGFETVAVHSGKEPDPTTGAIIPPIYAVSTYAQDSVAHPRLGYVYSRSGNPTRASLETCMAALEKGSAAFAFASGMAAEDTLIRVICKPGDNIIIPDDVYGGTFRLLDKILARWGISYTPVAISDADAVGRAVVPGKTSLIWCETPTNPLLNIADIRLLAAIARDSGALLAVDNTFSSPYLQRPLELGADAVVHSTTKYLGGHSDVVGGALVVRDQSLAASIKLHQNSMGAIPSPFDAWLTLRGIRTLAVRMDRQCESAATISAFLQDHPAVDRVFYPGLSAHPGHDVALKQMSGFGGVVSFTVRGGEAAALKVCSSTRLFTLAESLGAVESLITHPLRMTHASAAGSPVAPPAELIRLSVGLESPDDLVGDLRAALDGAA
ncbi:MAG TPA: cystathionine gamma-synthase [Streptosporangiaceae bacterium]|nr:cystathionine gamma-synthase [Streptosporangiaceae bacterium]